MNVVERLDAVVDDYCRRTRFFHEPLTLARAKTWLKQHRLNTRYRNSVLKLAVATNCPDWDLRLKIIAACSEEIIADHEFAEGKAHWQVIEQLCVDLGLTLEEVRAEEPLPSTRLCWLAWEALMKNRHWLEGLIANTCAERANVPGYGIGLYRELGRAGYHRRYWAEHFGLRDEQLAFFKVHQAADVEHSNLGWQTIARYAEEMKMEDAVVEACRVNLLVWETFWNGLGDAADAQERAAQHAAA